MLTDKELDDIVLEIRYTIFSDGDWLDFFVDDKYRTVRQIESGARDFLASRMSVGEINRSEYKQVMDNLLAEFGIDEELLSE